MKTIPMIFNTEMVMALLDGRKTVTRRPTKKNVTYSDNGGFCCDGYMFGLGFTDKDTMKNFVSSKHSPCKVGDLIWVRETSHCLMTKNESGWLQTKKRYFSADNYSKPEYEVDDFHIWKTIPSIHMPRWASRLTLRVTDVRIERVQDITEEKAVSEGMPTDKECQKMAINSGLDWYQKPTVWFKHLWNSIYSNWNENPYVWVVEFEVIHKNVGEVRREK